MKFRALRSQHSERVLRLLKLSAFFRGYLTVERCAFRDRIFSLLDAFEEFVEVRF
jgi:hypothetical protein